jgi:hypothetical protein
LAVSLVESGTDRMQIGQRHVERRIRARVTDHQSAFVQYRGSVGALPDQRL